MTELTLQTLLDRAEISDVIHRYAMAIDTRDWKLFRTCFTDDVVADATSFIPDLVVTGADEWVAWVAAGINGLDATQHIITNHAHDIEGDSAKCSSYMHAQHVLKNDLGSDQYLLAGHYNYHMARTPDGWKIKSYVVTVSWASGNAALIGLGAELLEAEAAAE